MTPLNKEPKVTVEERMRALRLTTKELAKEAGVSKTSVYRLLDPDWRLPVREDVAGHVAEALGLEIHEISWPNGLTGNGRPARTGCEIVRSKKTHTTTLRQVLEDGTEVTTTTTEVTSIDAWTGDVCTECWTQRSGNGSCLCE